MRITSRVSAPYGLLWEDGTLVVSHKPGAAAVHRHRRRRLLRVLHRRRDGDGVSATTITRLDGRSRRGRPGVRRRARKRLPAERATAPVGAPPRDTFFASRGTAPIEELAGGFRFAMGIAKSPTGDIFVTDNQGVGNTFNELNHIARGGEYGVPSLYEPKEPRRDDPPAVRLPHPWTRSVNGITFLNDEHHAPFGGQILGCEIDNRKLVRMSLDRVDGAYQGAAYPFSREDRSAAGLLGPLTCAVHPGGDLYIGSIHDSGWGGGPNVGTIVRFRRDGPLPFGVQRVELTPTGFAVRFTAPCDAKKAANAAAYRLAAYRRVWAGGYASPDRDRHEPKVVAARVSPDRTHVELDVSPLRAGYVYEIHTDAVGPGEAMWPRSAYYTAERLVAPELEK